MKAALWPTADLDPNPEGQRMLASTQAMYPTETSDPRKTYTAQDAGRRVGDVEMAISSLGSELDQLDASLNELYSRLDIALRPPGPQAGDASAVPSQTQVCILSRTIREHGYRVAIATARVKELLERIDL